MSERICLLRGVNVGGVKVPMAELKAIAVEAGFANPRTLLASGNLVIESDADPTDVEARLEKGIAAHFGRPIEVIVRTPPQWAALGYIGVMYAAAAMETLSHNVARFNQQAANPWQLAFSWGCVEYDPASHPSLNALVATADRLMYQAKQKQGRERR